jgi:hypothetical protein
LRRGGKKNMRKIKIDFKKPLKNIMSDFTATHNPFNQNLNYEKILRFSVAKIWVFFHTTKSFIDFFHNISKYFFKRHNYSLQ